MQKNILFFIDFFLNILLPYGN